MATDLQKAPLCWVDVVQRYVHVIGLLADDHSVPLAEGAPPNVLPTDADVKPCGGAGQSTEEKKQSNTCISAD